MIQFGKRFISMMLVMVMLVSVIPMNVFAWSNKSHANSANIILLEHERSAKQNFGRSTVTVRAP